MEKHLASCSGCREELSELLRLLYPEAPEDHECETSPSEIDQLVSIARKAGGKAERVRPHRPPWTEWAAAAAAIILSVTAIWGYKIYSERSRSSELYAQAKSSLEQSYQADSPSGLFLDLPFQPGATTRGGDAADSLERAKTLFVQALTLRAEMVEAHLGLGSVYLSQLQFSRARDHFRKVLDAHPGNPQAIVGHGVALSEEARTSTDPAEQSRLLARALADFDAVLASDPSSLAARYNRIQILVETGMHRQALREIEQYLSKDSGSIWAERLKTLRTRIRLNSETSFEEEVRRAAMERNEARLEALAAVVPARVPAAIRSALKRSLRAGSAAPGPGAPGGGDYGWAAAVLEKAYSSGTGDTSYGRLLRYYGGLSPPDRILKKSLDARFETLVEEHRKGNLASALLQSTPLLTEFTKLEDHWQILNIHHLRGYCFYYLNADFDRAIESYGKMLESAERTGSPDLIAKSLASLAVASLERGLFDEAMKLGSRLNRISRQYRMEAWLAYSSQIRGTVYRNMNAFDRALREYSTAFSLGRKLRDETVLPSVLEDLALLMDRMGRLEDARWFYGEALLQHESFADGTIRAKPSWISRRLNLLTKQADLALRHSDYATAERLFGESIRDSGEMKELEARNRIGLAQVYLATKRPENARRMLRECRRIAASGRFPEIEWQTAMATGLLLKESGRIEEAAAAFGSAIATLEKMRRGIGSDGMRQAFLTQRFGPHKELVSLLFHSPDGREKALECSDRSKSITLREYLRANTPEAAEFWSGARKLPQGEIPVTLEYFQGNDEVFIFLTGPGLFESATAEMNPEQTAQRVREIRESIRNRDEAKFLELSTKLYRELVFPVERHLEQHQGRILAILPDAALHDLPFSGLVDPGGKFLVEKMPLVFAPSRSVLLHSMSLDRGSAGGRDRAVLLLDGSANLPGAGGELAELSKLYGTNSRLLRSEDLSGGQHAVERSEILHFSGHAEVVGGQSVLAFGSTANASQVGPHHILEWRLDRSRLINLAGCNTALGPQAEGEAPWGLIPAFLSAGAPALMASLLPVEDGTTWELNRLFYDRLISGSGKAAALREAQLSILKAARLSGRIAPLKWTPFVLVGDPR
jgi:CHAT domain-containing protein/thioredoxin-like negative regulator of GroEL